MNRIGFDNEKYLSLQSKKILERIDKFGGKLYLEFGGKLFDDFHASRVLPGFEPDSKIKMLMTLKDEAEIVIVVSAGAIEKNKRRGDLGITYDLEVLRLIDAFHGCGLYVGSVVITHYQGQKAADAFEKRLKTLGLKVYKHYMIENYPYDIPLIVSDEGFGKNDYIETSRKLVVVTAPGPGSGKMATCLSQLYHENKRGISAGYAKYETFPIWNLPLKHPVNVAYEAATADLSDVNMIDNYHLEAYGQTTVNYNRDIEIFPVLKAMFEKISNECPYNSPTDMGVNMAGYAICNDEACRRASEQEILRRYYKTKCGVCQGLSEPHEVDKIETLMRELNISAEDRPVVNAALKKSEESDNQPAVAIELNDGRIVTGKTSSLLGSSAAALLNSLKMLAKIDDETLLIAREIIEPIQKLKTEYMGNSNPRLHTDEILVALSICATHDINAKRAMDCLKQLQNCEAHSTVILSRVDENVWSKLGVNMTYEPKYQTKKLYHR